MLKIGSHVPMRGTKMYQGSVEEALSFNANSFMIYTGAPQNTRRKEIEDLQIDEAVLLMEENNLSFDNVVVHAPYIVNLANPDQSKRDFAIDFLTKEIIRTDKMHVSQMVLHPGSAVGKDRPQAIKWIAEGLNKIIENTKDLNVKIALETMAGKGNEVGKTFEEIAEIISLVNNKNRVSVCFDTCHVYDAGYDIKENLEEVLNEFHNVVGLDKISVLHINDSKNPFKSHKDRHENIGFGSIGFEALLNVIYHERFKNIPKILETPFVEDYPPYKFEIEMIRNKQFNPNLKEEIVNFYKE